ncbi:hypothetical protein RE428_31860 [Marinobacter nanhaiticus D15-8W]|uniref:Uncharacterized protein n=1 Tax=Marinobacter nanhaiticus D15-8W TaxID=626887 RepID=N6W324_9GAMM|nr:hypothetical protein [Marinobacter nanhaiticus]ENO16945.1 hypothetical protein J057_01700 [Marinobacter nanhaiticus D15-8W]BES72168.1 hypothetical protein RE428_31860 [Marinobacter nanhaiticus D15-8W]
MSKPDKSAACFPPEWEPADVRAIQSLASGEATPDMQKRALDFLINKACLTYDLSYRPGSDRETTFAEGRRFVGLQIVKLLHINLAAIKQAKQ